MPTCVGSMSGAAQYVFTVHIFLLVRNRRIQIPKTGEQTAESCTGVISHREGTVTHVEEVNECKSDVCMKHLLMCQTFDRISREGERSQKGRDRVDRKGT